MQQKDKVRDLFIELTKFKEQKFNEITELEQREQQMKQTIIELENKIIVLKKKLQEVIGEKYTDNTGSKKR